MCEIQNLNKWLASVVYANVQDIFSPVCWNTSLSETANLLLRIILESFKLRYFFLIRNTCHEYFAVQTQISSDASSC